MSQKSCQGPPVPVRISRSQITAIRDGLGKLRAACRILSQRNNPPWSDEQSRTADRELLARVLRLWRTTRSKLSSNSTQTKYRLQLNAEQLALCSFGIRFARQYQSTVGADSLSSQECGSARALLRKLEQLRKRAKRATIKKFGTQAYAAAAKHLRAFQLAARREIFPKVPAYLDFSDHLLRFRIYTVNTLVRHVSQRYQTEGLQLPPAKDIRSATRLLLRYVRLGRVPVGIPDLLRNTEFAGTYHFNFVSRHCSGV